MIEDANLRAQVARRFYRKVRMSPFGCWRWLGCTIAAGYGQLTVQIAPKVHAMVSVHRLSYILHNGDLEEGLHVLHSCDVPRCVRYDHLFTGTHQENMNDKISKGRDVRGVSSHLSKLTEEQAQQILLSNAPAACIADSFGVTKGAIYNIRNGWTWKHLTPEARYG